MSSQSYGFYLSEWRTKKSSILSLRQRVLIEEFGSQQTSLIDRNDAESFHVIAYDGDSTAIGTGCMSKDGTIRQVVVLNQWRRRTIGKAIVMYLVNITKVKNLPCTFVNAPSSILGFYQSLDFEKTDVTESLDGVLHQKMVRLVSKSKSVVH